MSEQIDAAIKYLDSMLPLLDALTADAQRARAILYGMDGDNPKQVTIYAQRDPQWASVKLGKSKYTIGSSGCLISSVASCLTDAGYKLTPKEFNDWLIAYGGYSMDKDNQLVDFIFAAPNRLGVILMDGLIECANTPAPIAELDRRISKGDYVVVKVDFDPKTIQVEQHWCRYIGGGQVVDPWYADIAPIVPRYRGRDAAQAIIYAVIYKAIAKG